MTYTVTKKFKIKAEYADTIAHSTMEEFKSNVMLMDDLTDDQYIDLLRAANIPLWNEKEAEFLKARSNKVESFDAETKEYTVTRTWDSLEQWAEYSSCIAEANLQATVEQLGLYYDEEIV